MSLIGVILKRRAENVVECEFLLPGPIFNIEIRWSPTARLTFVSQKSIGLTFGFWNLKILELAILPRAT